MSECWPRWCPRDLTFGFSRSKAPKEPVASLAKDVSVSFVEGVKFEQGAPDLNTLPLKVGLAVEHDRSVTQLWMSQHQQENWMSVFPKLVRQQDKPWAEQVDMNVNRWRGQMGLSTVN